MWRIETRREMLGAETATQKRVETRREMLAADVRSINLASYGQNPDSGEYIYRFMVNGDSFNDAYLWLTPQQGNTYAVKLDWKPVTGWSSQDLGMHEIPDLSEDAMINWTAQLLASLPAQEQ